MVPDVVRYALESTLGMSPAKLLVFLLDDRLYIQEHCRAREGFIYESSPRIEKKTGMKRTTQYRALQKLGEKGLVVVRHQVREAPGKPKKLVLCDSNIVEFLREILPSRSTEKYIEKYIEPFYISVPKWNTNIKNARTHENTHGFILECQNGTQTKSKFRSSNERGEIYQKTKRHLNDDGKLKFVVLGCGDYESGGEEGFTFDRLRFRNDGIGIPVRVITEDLNICETFLDLFDLPRLEDLPSEYTHQGKKMLEKYEKEYETPWYVINRGYKPSPELRG